MTTPSGTIGFSDVNVELGRSSTASLNLNEGSNTVLGPRFLAGVFSGQISMDNLRNQTLFKVVGTSADVSGIDTVEAPAECTVTTDSASVGTVSGGTSPYSYSWQFVSGQNLFTVNSPTSSSTTFTSSVFLSDPDLLIQRNAVYRCTITDSIGRIIVTTNVGVQTTHQSI